MAPNVSAEFVYLFVPTVTYWVYSGFYALFGSTNSHRLHPKEEEEEKNIPSRLDVVKLVLTQQSLQLTLNLLTFPLVREDPATRRPEPPLLARAAQFVAALVIMDTWQYWWHRYLHTNKFLYRHVHCMHHSVIVPYAYAAMYAHPMEGFLEWVGGGMAAVATGMRPTTAVVFYVFGMMKTVDDHCGFMFPWHPFRLLLPANNTAFHDVHHQYYGNKYNYAQPFFVAWDKLMGTYMPYSLVQREDGGVEARPVVKKVD